MQNVRFLCLWLLVIINEYNISGVADIISRQDESESAAKIGHREYHLSLIRQLKHLSD